MNLIRKSPLHDAVAALQPECGAINDMQAALQFDHGDGQRMAALGIADLSSLWRHGLKGPGSLAWLETQGIVIPEVNSYEILADGGLIARLGKTEFMLEDEPNGTTARRLQSLLAAGRPHAVYPVLRQDAALVLTGTAVQRLLRQTCSFNFMSLDITMQPLVLTTMVGVAVTILPVATADALHYRIWCDGTYGEYLWRTLLDIANELDGGAVGLNYLILEGKSQ